MQATSEKHKEPVRQLSIFADNKVGRLNDFIQCLAAHDIHIMAISQLDTTECTIMRVIVDYFDHAIEILQDRSYAYTVSEILAVEISSEADLKFITCALVEAEINIHYIYPFLSRPNGHCGLALSVEDNDLAAQILQTRGLKILTQQDIAR